MIDQLPEDLRFDEKGLIPAVVQDADSGTVLMLAYMNRESLALTLETGQTHFWSRSRNALWHKGGTSGHFQKVRTILFDCDADALLVKVEQTGVACHKGSYSCFTSVLGETGEIESGLGETLGTLARTIHQRNLERPENSYTTKLLVGGIDRILKKVGEEAGEVIIASKNHRPEEISWEVADLLYHLLVMLESEGVPVSQIAGELGKRFGQPGKDAKKT
jgi:phosphoribosyl-AMP cyclohydrolase / phosphoribosyl-ATP pyrophosphohydrolase